MSQSGDRPHKAYLVKYSVVNQMEAVVYADNLGDARRRFAAGEVESAENTHQDYRRPGVKIQRFPEEDR